MGNKYFIRFLIVTIMGCGCFESLAGQNQPEPLVDYFNSAAAQRLLKIGVDEVVFVKRKTFNANHFYTENVNSKWMPGGNLCVLNLKNGAIRELAPSLSGGVFNRFDVSYDAQKVVFGYRKEHAQGYRIYEVKVDGTDLRQLTFAQENEASLTRKYGSKAYHHATDDMHPCYLPDGGIAFVSTRCQYGIICNKRDQFTTSILYRMDGNGQNIRPLSNSTLSEASPVMLPDGRILYHRWEYNDKAAGNAKCLWAMRSDGSGSAEVYGNTLTQPETLIYARPIPGAAHKLVSLACTHCCPNNAMGTIITIDTTKNIRTKEPIEYITDDVDARQHNGFNFLVEGKWVFEKTGKPGRLFKDPYPLSEELFMVSMKPKGYTWNNPAAYDLYLLDSNGEVEPLFQSHSISCWHPYPLVPRERPSVAGAGVAPELAAQDRATCMVMDVYVGMPEVVRGTVKYLRIMEQVPRPWAARNRWAGDYDGMAHSAIGMGRLGLKVQYGVVPVESDGSACFEVPANRNIYFQALDENYMAVQTERTYVNYMPGETRSCVGCHETPDITPASVNGSITPLALQRVPSKPQSQPGDSAPQKLIDYQLQVQPVWDKHCVSCHSGAQPKGGLCLTGEPTRIYSRSYEALMTQKNSMRVPYVGEFQSGNENKGSADISYRNAYHSGSHTSPLVTVISNGRIPLHHPEAAEIRARLGKAHPTIKLTTAEFVNVVNWLDSFCQYYPSYWGLKNAGYKDQPFYRPQVQFKDALERKIPSAFAALYRNPPKLIKRSQNNNKKVLRQFL